MGKVYGGFFSTPTKEIIIKTLFFIATSLAVSSAHAQQASFDSLHWLAGCWQHENGEPGSMEQWMPAAADSMLGMARTVKKGKTVAHEFMQIRLNAEGKLIFIALPSGQTETTFSLRQSSPQSIEFDNPQHDFPQRVSYQWQAPNKLLARIEGVSKGKQRAIDFPMIKVACTAQ